MTTEPNPETYSNRTLSDWAIASIGRAGLMLAGTISGLSPITGEPHYSAGPNLSS